MTATDLHQITDVVEHILNWPPAMRIALARRILETLERPAAGPTDSGFPRGPSAAEVATLFKTDKAAPDDATVRQWIEEHRMEKYGQ